MRFFLSLIALFSILITQAQVNVQIQPDGKRYSKILLNGAVSAKYDLVFIGDGFTASDQQLFNTKVNEAVNALRSSEPYASKICSFNIWKVNVISKESGISNPNSGITRNTELGCRFGDRKKNEVERCIFTNFSNKCYEAAGYAPAYDAVFILVNDQQWGGCEGGLVFSTIATGFAGIVTHELGHKIANLGDEYQCLNCDPGEPAATYHGTEPVQVNLTIQNNRSKIKWSQFILQATPVPTKKDRPFGVVGLFEGGFYASKGIFRPQFHCLMENVNSDFCTVCKTEMIIRLNNYCSTSTIRP